MFARPGVPLLVLVLLSLVSGLRPLQEKGQLGDKLRNWRPVRGDHIHLEHLERGSREVQSHFRLAAHPFLQWSLTVDDEQVSIPLEANTRLFHAGSTSQTYDANGLVKTESPVIYAYTGMGELAYEHRLTLISPERNVWSGYFIHGDDIWYLTSAHEYEEELAEYRRKRNADESEQIDMVLYHQHDVIEPEDVFCGVMEAGTLSTDSMEGSSLRRYPLSQLGGPTVEQLRNSRDKFTPEGLERRQLARRVQDGPPADNPDCPQTKKRIYISTACDWCFASRNTANLDASIQNIWNNVATQYDEEINVEIVIDETIKLTAKDSTSWNTMNSCTSCNSISQTLYDFSQWRGTRSASAGLWALLTNCYSSGTVGLAWLSQVCNKDVSSQGSNPTQYVSGTSVSSNINNGWKVLTHELGHNFGSSHTPDGFMIASNIAADWFSQTSQDSICGLVSQVIGPPAYYWPNCFTDGSSDCGNGRVEAGELCDVGASCSTDACCDCSCQLKAGKTCLDGPCCDTSNCTYYPQAANQVCAAGSQCSTPITCNGVGKFCPLPDSSTTGPFNGQNCTDNGDPAICYNGVCGGGCFGLPTQDKFWCIEACQQIGYAETGNGTFFVPCPSTECWLGCVAQPFGSYAGCPTAAGDYCCDVEYGQTGYALPRGTACSLGVCDGNGVCVSDFQVNSNSTTPSATPLPPYKPDYVLTDPTCPADSTGVSCGGQGDCRGNVCYCYTGYRGIACSFGPEELPQTMGDPKTDTATATDAAFFVIRDLARNQNVSITVEGTSLDLSPYYRWNQVAVNDSRSTAVPEETDSPRTYSTTTDYPAATSDLYITIYGTSAASASFTLSWQVNREEAFLTSVIRSLASDFVSTNAFWTVIGIVAGSLVLGGAVIGIEVFRSRRSKTV